MNLIVPAKGGLRMIEAIGNREAQAMLRRNLIGHLGCNVDGEPYVLPINYIYDGDCVFIHSLPGRKINALRDDPRCCLQVEEIRDEYNWRSVIAFGRYEEITNAEERERILGALYKRFPHLTPVESGMTKGLPEIIVFRLRVEQITGVSEDWK